MKPVNIYVRPFNSTTSARVDVRIGDGAAAADFATGGQQWEPVLSGRPEISGELFALDLSGEIQAAKVKFDFLPKRLKNVTNAELLYWNGAPVVINIDGILEGPSAIADFVGVVKDASYDITTGKMTINAEVAIDALLDKSLLTKAFSGAGGSGGDANKRGVLYPAGFGIVPNIEPVWFDLTRNIGMIDGYANTLSITWLGEGRSSFGASVGDYPSYVALAAAIDAGNVPPGRWATCIAEGMVGLGAPPTGVITVDATFGSGKSGAWIQRILSTHAGLAGGQIDAAAFTALDAQVNRLTHYWTADQRSIKDLIQAIARAANASPLVNLQGVVSITRVVSSGAAVTLDRAGGGSPRVLNWKPGKAPDPYMKINGRAARPARVLTFDEVNYVDTIIDRGVYASGTTYRAGNTVWLADGSQWIYINATPSNGHAPPSPATSDAYWQQTKPAQTANDIKYLDGTPVQNLQPNDPGSTRNDDGNNMIASPYLLDRCQLGGGAFRQVNGAAGRPADNIRMVLPSNAAIDVYVAWDGQDGLPVQPGDTLYYGHTIYRDAGTTDSVTLNYGLYSATLTPIGGGVLPSGAMGPTDPSGTWVRKTATLVVPNNVAYVQFYAQRAHGASPGAFYVAEPYVSRGEQGATRNDDPANLIKSPGDSSKWTLYSGAVIDNTLTRPRVKFPQAAANVRWGDFVPCQGDQTLYFRYVLSGDTANGDTVNCSYLWRDAAGNVTAVNLSSRSSRTGVQANVAGGIAVQGNFVTPTNCVAIQWYVERATFSAGNFYVDQPWLGKTQYAADVTADSQVTMTTTTTKTIPADSTGTIAAGTLPTTVAAPKVTRGGSDITQSDDTLYAIVTTSGGCVGNVTVDTVNGSTTKGVQTISAGFNATGAYQLQVTVKGVVQPLINVTVTKKNAEPSTGGGGGGGGGTSTSGTMSTGGYSLSGGTFVQIGSTIANLTVASGKTASCSGGDDYSCLGSGLIANVTAEVKWQYSPAGAGTWTDIGASNVGVGASYNQKTGDDYPGSVSIGRTVAPAAGAYDFRLMGRVSSGSSGASANFQGTGSWGVNIA